MPEDGNGAGLLSLFWGLWIYWFLSSWCEYLSKAKEAQRPGQATSPGAISALNASAPCEELEALVSRILTRCGGIAVGDFLNERLAAYETIVAAFDSGDRGTLGKHVSPEVYDAFLEAIAAREGRREKTQFAEIARPEIVGALVDEAHAEISVRFVADSYQLSGSSPSGRLIERTPDKRHSIDVWTFGCTSPTNKWRVIATEAE